MKDAFRHNLRHPQSVALYDYWRGQVGEYLIPIQTLFFKPELERWAGNLIIMRVRETSKLTYALYGTTFRKEFGVDMTGASVDDLPNEQAALLKAEYLTAANNKKPLWRLYTSWFEDEMQTWERLTLPLANARREVSLILASAYKLDDGRA